MVMVGDATEEEAERLILKALPVEWKKRVEVEVEKRNRDGALVIEGLPSALEEAQVVAFMTAETGTAPKLVERISVGKWNVKGTNEHHRASIMKLSRQRLEGGGRLIVRQVEDRLKVRDIDQLMRRWLKVDERVSYVSKGDRMDHKPKDVERKPHFAREVVVESDEEAQPHDHHAHPTYHRRRWTTLARAKDPNRRLKVAQGQTTMHGPP